MQTIAYSVPFGSTYGFGSAPPMPAADQRLSVVGGVLTRAGKRFRLYGTTTYACSSAPETDADVDALIARLVSQGRNNIRFGIAATKKYLEPTVNAVYGNWGMMTHALSEGVTDNTFDATALLRMDRLIYKANQAGIYVSIWNNTYGEYLRRVGVRQGTYGGAGMYFLFPRARAIIQAAIEQLLTRVNTYTGVRYCDNPGIESWQISNEDGLKDMLTRPETRTFGGGLPGDTSSTTQYIDQIVGSLNGNGEWKAEADAIIQAYWTSRGWGTVPGGQFPSFATMNNTGVFSSGSADCGRDRFEQFILDTEVAAIQQTVDWLRAFNPAIHVVVGDTPYFCGATWSRINRPNISMGQHLYAPSWDQVNMNLLTGVPYQQAGSTFANDATKTAGNSFWYGGGNWGYQFGGIVPASIDARTSEDGQYGDRRWNYEPVALQAVFSALNDRSVIQGVSAGQQKQWFKAIDTQGLGIHVQHNKPAIELTQHCFAPIFINGWIDPLPSHTTRVSLTDWLAYVRTGGQGGKLGGSSAAYNHQAGNTHPFLKKRLFYEVGDTTALDAGNWPTNPLSPWATYQATTAANPVVIQTNADGSTQVGVHGRGVVLHRPRRMFGWINEVPQNSTVGVLSTGTMTETVLNALLMLRADTDGDIFSVESTLFCLSHDFQLDSAGFSLTEDGDGASHTNSVTSWGTFQNIRLRTPEAIPLTLNVGARDQYVLGVAASGDLVDLSPSYNGGTGLLTFSTNPLYPKVRLIPKATASRRAVRTSVPFR